MRSEEIVDYRTLTIPYEHTITAKIDIMEIISKLESMNILIDETLFKCIANNTIGLDDFLAISNIAIDLIKYLNIAERIYNIKLQKIIISTEHEEDLEALTTKVKAIVFAESWEILIKVWKQAINYLHDKYNDKLINIDIILTMNP